MDASANTSTARAGDGADAASRLDASPKAVTGNGVNVLAMGAFYVTPELGKQCADAFLYNDFGSGWEWWPDFDRFHQIAIDEHPARHFVQLLGNRTEPSEERRNGVQGPLDQA